MATLEFKFNEGEASEGEVNDTLENLLNFNEIEAQEEGYMDSDEFPYPHIFKLQAMAIRTMLANPDYEFPEIGELKSIFSEGINSDIHPTIDKALHNFKTPKNSFIKIAFENFTIDYYYATVNNKPAIFYSGIDGYSSSNFDFFGVIF